MQAFASNDRARSMQPGQITELMDTMMGICTPIYQLMVVADRSGHIIAVNTVDLEGKPIATEALLGSDVSGEAWFKQAVGGSLKPGETFEEDLHEDALTRSTFAAGPAAHAMSFAYPIFDANGGIVGVWSSRFNANVVRVVIDNVQTRAHEGGAKSTQITLVSADGVVLVSPNKQASRVGSPMRI